MSDKNLVEQAADHGASPSDAAKAAAQKITPPVEVIDQPATITDKPAFDVTKFTHPETGNPYTYRDGSIFDPETAEVWPKMKPDGSPDLTVDGFLRKTNSGKNKSMFEKAAEKFTEFFKPKKTEQQKTLPDTPPVEHPKPDEIIEEERIIEQAAETADAEAERLRVEATRQQQLESQTSAKSVVALTQTIARAVGGAGATLDDEERKFLEGSVYRYEMVTGHRLPLPPEVSLIGDFASVYGAKFEKAEVKKTFEKRWGFFMQKFQMIGAFLKGRASQPSSAQSQPPGTTRQPSSGASQPADFPILEQQKS